MIHNYVFTALNIVVRFPTICSLEKNPFTIGEVLEQVFFSNEDNNRGANKVISSLPLLYNKYHVLCSNYSRSNLVDLEWLSVAVNAKFTKAPKGNSINAIQCFAVLRALSLFCILNFPIEKLSKALQSNAVWYFIRQLTRKFICRTVELWVVGFIYQLDRGFNSPTSFSLFK